MKSYILRVCESAQRLPLRFVHEQAALRPAPQHILRAARPLVVDEVPDFTLGQARAVFLSEHAVADNVVGKRAMASEDGA